MKPQKPRRNARAIQPIQAAMVPNALLSFTTAEALTGLSEQTMRRREATDPTFPKFIKLGTRCTRIRAGDLMTWLAAQKTAVNQCAGEAAEA